MQSVLCTSTSKLNPDNEKILNCTNLINRNKFIKYETYFSYIFAVCSKDVLTKQMNGQIMYTCITIIYSVIVKLLLFFGIQHTCHRVDNYTALNEKC